MTLENKSGRLSAGDVTGAFADGAILFPLLVALSVQTGMDGAVLLASAGVAYVAAGLFFRVPMSVQPLKAVVVAALAVGASAAEISMSGFIVGLCCFALSFFQADRLAALAPRHLVHGLQMALGIMLLTKGFQVGVAVPEFYMKALFLGLAAAVILLSLRTEKPVMGWVAGAGVLAGLFLALKGNAGPVVHPPDDSLDVKILLALVLPQMVLTLANSVIGTYDVARRYFGDKASLVTPKRLLRSIGVGNVILAPLGGMPFCHGAGGVTAHVKGGAQTWRMNLVIGCVLGILAGVSLLLPVPLIPAYPEALMAALLMSTGWFHLRLAEPSWKEPRFRWGLVVMGLAAFLTQDMLWVLGAGIACEGVRAARKRMERTGGRHDIF